MSQNHPCSGDRSRTIKQANHLLRVKSITTVVSAETFVRKSYIKCEKRKATALIPRHNQNLRIHSWEVIPKNIPNRYLAYLVLYTLQNPVLNGERWTKYYSLNRIRRQRYFGQLSGIWFRGKDFMINFRTVF